MAIDAGQAIRNAHDWFEVNSGWAPPDEDTLAEWLDDGVCRCPDECLVEPEGWCSHGLASWRLILRAMEDQDGASHEMEGSMGDGFWSDTAAPGGEWNGVPGKGCWFRRKEGRAFWMTGGAHEHWNGTGAEGGSLGFPTSNLDPTTGVQTFENGAIWWDGDEFRSGPSPVDARPPSFHVEPPPEPPLG